jgi:rhamnogalacturonan endolyase
VWKGPHYGGTEVDIPQGQAWTKTIGPFLLYCNSGATPDAMWKDALGEASAEAKKWPYAWAVGAGYPAVRQLGGFAGQVVLHDPAAPGEKMTNLLVGLTHPDYALPNGQMVDWQHDGEFYQYWARAERMRRAISRLRMCGQGRIHCMLSRMACWVSMPRRM